MSGPAHVIRNNIRTDRCLTPGHGDGWQRQGQNAADRLRQILADLNIAHRDMLEPAVDLAGRQLK